MLKKVGWNEFVHNVVQGKNVICIGAGKRLEEIWYRQAPQEFFERITDIIDSDPKKQGNSIGVNGRSYIIKSMDTIYHDDLTGKCILITMAYEYFDVIEKLKAMGIYDNTDIYLFSLMKMLEAEDSAMAKEVPSDIIVTNAMMIPKKIHYCWFGGNPIPEKNRKWMESWKKFCPDYEIIEWNEKNYNYTKNKYMYQAYKSGKWGFVPDYARLDIIYNYGGIYFDTDVELIANIDDLLYQKAFACFESDSYVALGLGFGAQKGNVLIKDMMDDYDNREFVKADGTMNMVASPVIQTEVLKKKGLITNGEYQVLDEITIYPEKMLCGKSPATRRVKLKPYTKAIHHYDGSWLDDEMKIKITDVENGLKDILDK